MLQIIRFACVLLVMCGFLDHGPSRALVEAQRTSSTLETLYSTKITKFEGKHMFFLSGSNMDINGNIFDSFYELTSNPVAAKRYITDLNLKLVKGNILPLDSGGQFEKWFKDGRQIVTIVDSDLKALKADVDADFKNWKKGHSKSGTFNKQSLDQLKSQFFTTKNPHTVTYLTFHAVEVDSTGVIIAGEIRAEQIKTTIQLGVDQNGYPKHLESFSLAPAPEKAVPIASFTREELRINAKVAREFWKDIGVKAKDGNVFLNENYPKYQIEKPIADAKYVAEMQKHIASSSTSRGGDNNDDNGNKRVSSSNIDDDGGSSGGICQSSKSARNRRSIPSGRSGCAVMLKPNGDVDLIDPKEFPEAYKKASPQEKHDLAEIVKKNPNKVITVDDVVGSMVQKMNSLVQLEDVKSHVSTAKMVDDVEKFRPVKKKKSPGTVAEHLEDLGKQLGKVKSKVKLSSSKVSKGLSSLPESKAGKGIATGVAAVSTPLSVFFLGKTLVNGIINGDTTSLAIVGSRVGFDVITGGTAALGAKYLDEATKLGKFTKAVGKWAGPIGAVADIGLSVWGLTKSVERFKNSYNKYDRDDAIADMVMESIDIVTTAVVTGLSMAFPPFAPIFVAVGLVINILSQLATALFKAANEVARIDSELPLLDFEKDRVFRSRFFDWFGTRQPDYIDQLVDVKKANDLAVQRNLKFLENNTNFLGIVFPSRTLHYDGACRLTRQHCWLANIWGCTTWTDKREITIGSGCDHGRPCGSNNEICVDDWKWKKPDIYGYDNFKCHCDGSEKTEFGYPRSNSIVDFRRKQSVYWERAVPKDVEGAEFQCKPGNVYYVDYKVSESTTRTEYFCENAIGLLQPSHRRKPGQTMLFDLDDGNDRVYQSGTEEYPSLFRMGNSGIKEFHGGGGKNQFLFDSACTGILQGELIGSSIADDGIILADTCAEGNEISVDFRRLNMTSSGNNLRFVFSSIEEFTGREGQADNVEVACTTKVVMGRGGSPANPDHVMIPRDPTCEYNLTVVGAHYTDIISEATAGDIYILVGDLWTGLNVELELHPKEILRQNLRFLQTSSSDVTSLSLEVHGPRLKLTLDSFGNQIHIGYRSDNGVTNEGSIYFTEGPNATLTSILFWQHDRESTSALFYHPLPNMTYPRKRFGCQHVANTFDISGGVWDIEGGDKADEFIVNTEHLGVIDGGADIDTLKVHPDFTGVCFVDLESRIKNVENVIGASGVPMSVITSCGTVYVASQGGSPSEADVITIPARHCETRNIHIFAVGHTKVVMKNGRSIHVDNDTVNVVIDSTSDSNLNVLLATETANAANLIVTMAIVHRNWSVIDAKTNDSNQLIELSLNGDDNNGGHDLLRMQFRTNLSASSQYLKIPYIQVTEANTSGETPGIMLIERDTVKPKIMYQLREPNNGSSSLAKGMLGIENVFRLTASSTDWNVLGGNLNDVFIVSTTDSRGGEYLLDGWNGSNTLIIDDNENGTKSVFLIHLATSTFGYLNTKSERQGIIHNIHNVVGRAGAAEVIHPNCDTKTINGNGGNASAWDQIQVDEDHCHFNLVTAVGKYTRVLNKAPIGYFTYHVEDLLYTSLDITTTNENLQRLQFAFHPWDVLNTVEFNQSTNVLQLGASDAKSDKVHKFPMCKQSSSNEYTNPTFEFQAPGSPVSTDIRVGANGVTMATSLIPVAYNPEVIRGLPVDMNRFLINITKASSNMAGRVLGCSDGTRCTANQFWILDLNTPLATLDGGSCEDGTCTNSLHFFENLQHRRIFVDMDIITGSVTTFTGERVIAELKNIHELQGTQATTAYVTCDTKQVSGAGRVVIENRGCLLNLVIGLQEYTTVEFQEAAVDDPNINDIQDQHFFQSTVHYRFAGPMSFEVDGSSAETIKYNHYFYLPFTLGSLSDIHFDVDEDTLYYTLNGREYYLSMITAPAFDEQFYSQPNMVTEDGYRIQVSRAGSIWASLGETSTEISSGSVEELQQLANNLAVTIMARTPREFFYIGHSSNHKDRNMLQNVASHISYLGGGGADDTIYDVGHLNYEVYIHTGYTEDSMDVWMSTGSKSRQTIDLTDIVVPIRNITGTKYLPIIRSDGDDLQISMDGYEDIFSGRVIVVNGRLPWVAKRVQVLLSSTIMTIEAEDETHSGVNAIPKPSSDKQKRSVETLHDSKWRLRPSPVVIPADISVYSISPEDLEDDQEVILETLLSSQQDDGSNRDVANNMTSFGAARNGTDLYLTNIREFADMEIQTVVISNFYDIQSHEPEGESDTATNFTLPRGVTGLTVNLPGLHLMINDSAITNLTKSKNGNEYAIVLPDWKQVLHDVEDVLLVEMPEMERSFFCDECQPWWKQSGTRWKMGIFIVLIISAIIGLWYYNRGGNERKGEYSIRDPNKDRYDFIPQTVDDQDGAELEILKLRKSDDTD